jgi:hypothetical protein
MKTIPAVPLEEETFAGPRPLAPLAPKLPSWTPKLAPASSTLADRVDETTIHHSVWQLEFSFKPVRTIEVTLPDGRGGQRTELVWYLLYQLRNTGSHLNPVPEQDASGNTIYKVQKVDHAVRCFPAFTLVSFDHQESYLDQVIPQAVAAIHAKELPDPRVKLHSSVEINTLKLPVSTAEVDRAVWGVATWRDVDPRTDFLAVYGRGLSNAYRWEDSADAAGLPPDEAATITYKTLQLNFWRPGDTVRETDDLIRYGMPDGLSAAEAARVRELYGVEAPVDYRWIYLP